jgi:N-acylglucosamine 2-epimerase (GlcNAc 2-epimerase)
LKYGFDEQKGGFFNSGPFNQPATDRNKVWWAQAEALVASLRMHQLTGEQKYLDVFARTWDFIDKYMIDWQHGEWRDTITPDGQGKQGQHLEGGLSRREGDHRVAGSSQADRIEMIGLRHSSFSSCLHCAGSDIDKSANEPRSGDRM